MLWEDIGELLETEGSIVGGDSEGSVVGADRRNVELIWCYGNDPCRVYILFIII